MWISMRLECSSFKFVYFVDRIVVALSVLDVFYIILFLARSLQLVCFVVGVDLGFLVRNDIVLNLFGGLRCNARNRHAINKDKARCTQRNKRSVMMTG